MDVTRKRELAEAALRAHLKVIKPYVAAIRTGPEERDGDFARFEFAAMRWEDRMPGAALWYVGTVKVNVTTQAVQAEIREHEKSRALVRHENFNWQDLHAAEEAIWAGLGYLP
jgi:hypothetical protein